MKPMTVCLALLLSVTIAAAAENKERPAPARVVMTGKAVSFVMISSLEVEIKPGDDVQKKLAEALKSVTATTFMLDEKAGIVVALPANRFKLIDVLKVLDKPMAAEGILTTTTNDLLVKLSGTKEAKRVPLLIADKVTLVDDKNKDSFPAENQATIEGTVKKEETKLGSETAVWAIGNADGRIPILLPKDSKPLESGAKFRASGRVRVVEGQLLLEVTKVEAMKK